MQYYIFYIEFEEKVMPVYCLDLIQDPIIEDHYLFTGVKHLDDAAFPDLKVNSISLPKKSIKYYLKGKEKVEKNTEISGDKIPPEYFNTESEPKSDPPKVKRKRGRKKKTNE